MVKSNGAYFRVEGPGFNKIISLDNFNKSEISIGRYVTCDIVLNSREVSRHHAIIFTGGLDYYIEDMGSSNGTFVNGVLIEKKKLENGDVIKIGDFTLTFYSRGEMKVNLEEKFETNRDKTIAFSISDLTNVGKSPFEKKLEYETQLKIINVILEASKTLLSSDSLDVVLSEVMDTVFRFLDADRGFLMLYDENEKELKPKVIKYREDLRKDSGITFSRSIVNKVFREGVSVLTEDATSDERFAEEESIIFQQIHSCMCVPLWINNRVIGIIYVDSLIFKNQFSEVDLYLLSVISMLSAAAIEKFKLSSQVEKEKSVRKRLERYQSPSVINKITSEELNMFINPERKDVSVIFCDIVDFTTLTKEVGEKDIALMLKTIFNIITDIVFENEGTLDKYMGDAVMVVFGAPFPQEDHADRAVKTAIEIQKAMRELNDSGKFSRDLFLRIGINSGVALCGDFGSDKRLEYTVIGDTVNLASRLESFVAESGEIIIGVNTKNLLKGKYDLEKIGPFSGIKGFKDGIYAYRVKF